MHRSALQPRLTGRIQAAKALYSYGVTAPPAEQSDEPAVPPPVLADGRRVTGLRGVVELATGLGVDIGQLALRRENAELRAENERLRNELTG